MIINSWGKGESTAPRLCVHRLIQRVQVSVYFVIDALDECEDGLADRIKLISASTVSDKVKWLVSSRPMVKLEIPETAGSLVELDTAKLKDPVNAYIDHKLSAFTDKPGYTKQVLDDVSAEILSTNALRY